MWNPHTYSAPPRLLSLSPWRVFWLLALLFFSVCSDSGGTVGEPSKPWFLPDAPCVVPSSSTGIFYFIYTLVPGVILAHVSSILPFVPPIGGISNKLIAIFLLTPQFLTVGTLGPITCAKFARCCFECHSLGVVFHLHSRVIFCCGINLVQVRQQFKT